MEITQGTFKDGDMGWKLIKGKDKCSKTEHYDIVYSDDEEHVCDCVYQKDDAKIITIAPEMFNVLSNILYDIKNNDGKVSYITAGLAQKALDKLRRIN